MAGEFPFEGIERIKASASRGAEIVRELMIYSGQEDAERIEPADLASLVEEMLELLKISISKQAVLKTDLQQGLPAVLGRASQLRQVVMNLIINASEAIGENDGVIKVTTSRPILPHEPGPGSPPHFASGDYLKLEISDTGGGMTAEAKAKAFDPFFSTKFAGRGLGLAVVQGIVRDHGGAINLVSAPGRGTRFEVFLPCIAGTAASSHSTIAAVFVEEHQSLAGTVLMVEDEGVLRLAVSKMLRKKGFGVIEACDGLSALELIRSHKNEIDVLLLDVTLPGMSGREVFEQALRLRSDLKIILTSAHSRETVDASFAGLRVESFIRKPFRFAELMQLLQDSLATLRPRTPGRPPRCSTRIQRCDQ
jgi:two-component system, cell cycle sensor histidine kinase and response regulator CckA